MLLVSGIQLTFIFVPLAQCLAYSGYLNGGIIKYKNVQIFLTI